MKNLIFFFIFILLIIPVSATILEESAGTPDTQVAGQTAKMGMIIMPVDHNLVLLNASLAACTAGITKIYLHDENGVYMANSTVKANYYVDFNNATQNVTLYVGHKYNITAYDEGGAYTACKLDPAVVPSAKINIAFVSTSYLEPAVIRNIEKIRTDSLAGTYEATMSICGIAPYVIPFINFTFKNETTPMESVKAILDSSFTWNNEDGSTSTYSFSETHENSSYGFCMLPPNGSISVTSTIFYSNTESQQRGYAQTNVLTNATTNITLYLLPTSLGQYVTFQIINPAEQPVSGATLNVSSSTYGDVESKTTDGSGGATFFLNPLSTYTVSVTATGYDQISVSVTPSQTLYTIQVGGASNVTQEDYFRGITYSVLPLLSSSLVNDTTYNFNLTLSSTYWNLENYGFILRNSTDQLNATNSTTSTGGTVIAYANSGSDLNVFMDLFWTINDTDSNLTFYWVVLDTSGNEWSFITLFDDLSTYMADSLFGLDNNFGLPLLIFFFIFIFTGVFAYKFGLTSPAAIMGIIFGLVLFFDVGLGLVPNPVNAVSHFPSIFVVILFVGTLFREVSR